MHKLVHSLQLIVRKSRKETTNHKPSTTNRKSKGFTLIEILVVISIMAVLAGGLIYSTNNARDKGKDSVRKQDLKSISAALTAYRADNNHWPPNDLLINPSPTLEYASDTGTDWIPDISAYINKTPNDPTKPTGGSAGCSISTKTYFYCYQIIDPDKKTFVLWAQLENLSDPQLITNTNASCQEIPPTPPLNYCIKSPQ